MTPAFLSRDVHFMITIVDSPGEEEGREEGWGREGRGEKGEESERRRGGKGEGEGDRKEREREGRRRTVSLESNPGCLDLPVL